MIRRPRSRSLINAALTAGLVLVGAVGTVSSASAAGLVVTDPSGDTQVPGLDLTGATLENDDYRLSTQVNFATYRPGLVAVGVKARDQSLVRIASRLRADGTSRSFLLDASDDRIPCRGLVVEWHDDPASVSFVVPSRCLWKGNYGAVRTWYLTESAPGGGDVDYAPERNGNIRFSEWVPRG